ncbi:uncharacterized protein LOC103281525 isoform X2 [Anolis carolinensis]|uniref:uncharacterized protein LOC103281525 isoform X2 n=1 Tax=Anolis carolinensis TaxID=28377 RepID=UPI002F2B878B
MGLLVLVGFAFSAVVLGVSWGSSPPILDVTSVLSPLEAARMAVEDYNEGTTGISSVFRLLKLRNTHKTRFAWGVHFSMNFTVKETHCQKTSSYQMGDCKYKPNGRASSGGRKTKSGSRPQAVKAPNLQMDAEPYFPSSFSTAALRAVEEK